MSKFIRTSAAKRRRTASVLLLAAAAALIAATPARAHGFGQRYDLPLPLSLYFFGAAAAVVTSFVILGIFVRHAPPSRRYWHVDLLSYPPGRSIAHPIVAWSLKLFALGWFIVAVSAGFLGNQNPYQNIAPTLVWIIWWVGFAYLSAFAGNLWALINPWRTLFDGAAWLFQRPAPSFRRTYPEALGVLPAAVMLLAFSWTELVYPSAAVPAHIAWLAVGYSAVTLGGMAVFGRETWLRHGEVFTLVFGTFARFAPTEIRVRDPSVCARCDVHCRSADGRCINCYDCFRRALPKQREWALRPFGAGLLDDEPLPPFTTAFVLLLLSSVLYDGALFTPEWAALENHLAALAPGLGDLAPSLIRTGGLIAFWLVFLGAYSAIAAAMSRMAAGHRSACDMARSFALTLVPIAIGYHLAHYLVFLLIQGQYILPLVSDPFGYGWNLFGTAGYRVDIAIVGARFAWYAAVAAIVLGHISAVYLAHRKATRLIERRGAALSSQVPLTALMVVYTFISLSILAEPIVERAAPAQPSAAAPSVVAIAADALLPEPGDGRLLPVGPGKLAKQKLTYRVFASAFHDGTAMSATDLLYAYMFAYRWGVRNPDEPGHYDPFIDTATAPIRQHLAGVRVVGTDSASKSFRFGDLNVVRELFIIEVYTTIPPDDPEQDAAVAPPWSTVPWHLIVLMDEAVSRGWGAFSQAEAARRGVEWLDLVRSEETNRRLVALVDTFARDGYRPDALKSLVSVDEARRRWTALGAYYKEHGHFLVTNGPYQLKRWSADGVALEVFRDLSYPLGVGSYDAYAVPRRGYVAKVERHSDGLRLFADIELVMKFQRSYKIERAALQSVTTDVLNRAAAECRYIVTDAEGRVVLAGLARPTTDVTFQLDFDGKLSAGSYTLLAEIILNGNTMNVAIERIPVLISPSQ
jgi:hypothetical protein